MKENEENQQNEKKEENQQKKELLKLLESIDKYNRKYRFPIDIKEIETNYEIAINYDDIRISERPYKEKYDFTRREVLMSTGLAGLFMGLTGGVSFLPLFAIYIFGTFVNLYIQQKETKKKVNFYGNFVNLVDCRKFEEEFYDEIIKLIKKNLNYKEYKDEICLLSKSFRFENKLKNSIEDILEIYSNFNAFENFQNYYNILVLGRTSVGKSTLINSILELDTRDQAEVGFGRPTTMKRRVYLNKNNKKLNYKLIDNRGIESSNYNTKNASDDTINYINEKNKNKNPNEYIQCIWFCFTGSSFLKEEEDFVTNLRKVYSSDEFLPIIMVHTKATNEEEIQNMEKLLIEEKKLTDCYVPVVAKDIIGRSKCEKKYGLDDLINKTNEKILQGKKSSYYGSLFKRFKNNFENKLINEPFEQSINSSFMKFENILYEHKKTKLYNIFGYEGIKPCLEKYKECFREILDNFSITKENIVNEENEPTILKLFEIVIIQIENQFQNIDKNRFENLIDQLILKIFDERVEKFGEYKKKDKKDFNKYIKENMISNRKGIIALFTIDIIIKDFFTEIVNERKEIFENLFEKKFKEDLYKLIEKYIKSSH